MELVQIQPPPAQHFLFESSRGQHVFLVDGSQVFDVEGDFAFADASIPIFPVAGVPEPPPLHSLSLNLAQSCNLRCGYCYADGGSFGAREEPRMDETTARKSVDLLLDETPNGATAVLGFMGGEPLLHRGLLHRTARYAADEAGRRGRQIRFSVTTNGTLITADDAALFRELDWTVQISLDGTAELHDRQRPTKSGASSHAAVLRGLATIERAGRPQMLTARATIAAGWRALPEQLDTLVSLGFDDAGFSPTLASSQPGYAIQGDELERFLAEMIECGRRALTHWAAGRRYPFSNLVTALRQIHRGSHQPYPCGAGAGYLSAGASGTLYACHRFVNDAALEMGHVDTGLDTSRRRQFLAERHVDRQLPCSACWARYLCGGGCHHEAIRAGRAACDYIRGWLAFCLRAYVELEAIP